MKTTKMIATLLATAVFALVFLVGQAVHAQDKAKPWPVPDKEKAIKAPVKMTDASVIANGKDLWAKNCKSCHGAKGMGDGPKSVSLKTFPGDFSAAGFQASIDAELFYRLNKGRDEMPSYEKKIPEANDRWALVAYMRTLKK
jgi:mono/diheme cytochrome c family protein